MSFSEKKGLSGITHGRDGNIILIHVPLLIDWDINHSGYEKSLSCNGDGHQPWHQK